MEKSPWAIVDTIRVPEEAGDYVLRFRWDCEANPQICASQRPIASRKNTT
jgi:hypothetical protein